MYIENVMYILHALYMYMCIRIFTTLSMYMYIQHNKIWLHEYEVINSIHVHMYAVHTLHVDMLKCSGCHTLLLELSTTASEPGIRSTWCLLPYRGTHTRAGRFRFSWDISAYNWAAAEREKGEGRERERGRGRGRERGLNP